MSPEVGSDRRITFRINAPQAQAVRVSGSDIPGLGQNGVMTKGENGVWTFTSAPVPPGAYRYNFNVDGVAVIDPRNPLTSVSNNNVWSLALVPGSDIFDTKQVPHGAVASVTYYSAPLKRHRRMHVYTPPGYESGNTKYPVFYLLHGAGDSDEAWTSVGRAGIILDNLIAAKKAKPMIVVMPAGHTNGPTPGMGGPAPALTIPPRPARRVHAGLHYGHSAVHREALPCADRPRESRDCRTVDGRQPDAEHRDSQPDRLRLHRRLQLGPARRWRRPRRGAAPAAGRPAAPHAPRRRSARRGRSATSRCSTTPPRRKA